MTNRISRKKEIYLLICIVYVYRLKQEIEAAQGESLRAFGSDKLLIEKYFESIRHVEVS